jgi:hypothetical protein
MLLAQRYVVLVRRLYGTKYTQFTVSTCEGAIGKEELDLNLLIFDLFPTEALANQLRIMESAGLLERRRDWLLIVWDAILIPVFGLGIYHIALSIQLDAHFFPIYAGVVACIILPIFLPRSRQPYAWLRMRNKYRPDELQRKLFGYKSFVPGLSPPSHEV